MSLLSRLSASVRRYLNTRASYQFFLRDMAPLTDLERGARLLETMRPQGRIHPVLRSGPRAHRVAVVAPHPDDEAMGPGGTVLRALAAGTELHVVYLTGVGEKDAQRCQEARAAGERFGFSTSFLHHPVRGISTDTASLKSFAAALTSNRPDAVFIPFLMDDHDDHRRASHLLMAATRLGLVPEEIEVWAYQVYTVLPGNVIVDVTDQVEAKAEFIRMYRSQAHVRDWAHWSLGLNAFNSRLLGRSQGPRYVEAFFVVPLPDYVDMCATYFDPDPRACYYDAGDRAST